MGIRVFQSTPPVREATTFRANTDTMEVENLNQLFSLTSSEQQRRFWNTMQAQSVMKSNFGMQLVNKGDQITNTQYSFAGLPEVYDSMCLDLAGAARIPVTKLFGRSPAGMNATGESDPRNYYDYVDTLRESKLRPILEKLLPILCFSLWGSVPDGIEINFPTLWTPTAMEIADIALKKAQAIRDTFQAGLFRADTAQRELKALAEETGMFGAITDDEIAANAGKTYQDLTALKDPLAGLSFEEELGQESPTEETLQEEESNPFEQAADSLTMDYSPDQSRDENGRFTSGGGNISGKTLTSQEESGKIQSFQKLSATGANKFKIGFTPKNLAAHMKRHGKEYPGFTAVLYYQYALVFIQQPVSEDVLGYMAKNGAIVRYRISTNDFVKGYIDGGIATMYKPTQGEKYFKNQKAKRR